MHRLQLSHHTVLALDLEACVGAVDIFDAVKDEAYESVSFVAPSEHPFCIHRSLLFYSCGALIFEYWASEDGI